MSVAEMKLHAIDQIAKLRSDVALKQILNYLSA